MTWPRLFSPKPELLVPIGTFSGIASYYRERGEDVGLIWFDAHADINTPEVHEAKCDAEAALGRRATQRLRALLNEGPFDLEYAGRRDHDKYGRDLRIVSRDGRSLGDILVAEGLAERWTGSKRDWCK